MGYNTLTETQRHGDWFHRNLNPVPYLHITQYGLPLHHAKSTTRHSVISFKNKSPSRPLSGTLRHTRHLQSGLVISLSPVLTANDLFPTNTIIKPKSSATFSGAKIEYHYPVVEYRYPFRAQDDRLRLKRADVLENITRNQTAIQILTGDVVFIKGDVTVHCDEARYIEKTGQGFMRGNVQVFQREQTLTCDSLQYDSPMDKITGFGTVHIWDPDYDLTADTVAWFTELDSGSALGNVTLKQTDQTITSRRLDYVKHPDQDAASYKALGNVTIFEEERIATCGAAIYDYNNERTILTVQPEIREKMPTGLFRDRKSGCNMRMKN